jgi:CzcA family heavy metal efflux pump
LLALAGLLTGRSLPSSIYPPLQFPRALVIARSGTLPARSMTVVVTRPLEQAAMEVPGIRRVRSTTFRGATEISAQFDPSTDMVVALQQLQNRVSEVRTTLPAGAELTVERLTPETFPVLSLNITGALPVADLHDIAFFVMRPALARAPGVGRVDVMASDTREIEVVADPAKLLANHLSLADVTSALRGANVLAPVGRFTDAGLQHLVLASGLWSSVPDIAATPIVVRQGATIHVADVADVFSGTPDRTGLITGGGRDAAIINVSQQIDSSILDVRSGVEQALRDVGHTVASGLQVTKVYDLAEFVSSAIANVRDAILLGGILAVVVLWVFLRDWRITLIAATTLPLTIVSTFLFMRLFGESINLMSMGGLAVAIGLVIDDAVVVVENIYRRLAAGASEEAIAEATDEIAGPVTGATFTTVVVFAPLGLLSGVVGQFFRALSITLSVAVLLSWVLSLTLIPLLARLVYRRSAQAAHREDAPDLLQRAYLRSLRATLRRPWLAAAGAVVIAVAAALLYGRLGTGFLPRMDEGGFVIDYLTPSGTALEETDRLVRVIERTVADLPEVAAFSRRTGSELGLFATQQNKGDVLVRLKPRGARGRSADEIIADLRPRLHAALPQVDIEFVQLLQDMLGDLEGAPTPIEVKIFGDDTAVLERLSAQVEPLLGQVQGVVDVVGAQHGNPEVDWIVDRGAAGRLGLSVAQVSEQLSAAWLGEVVTDLRQLDRTIPVRVRYPDRERFDPDLFGRIQIRGADGTLVTLDSLARPTRSGGESILTRENLRAMALVTARLEGRDLGSTVQEIRQRLAQLQLPVGYSAEVGGQYDSQRQAFRELLTVLGVAIALVLVVLVIEFGMFTPAALILVTAPLSFAGAFALLLLTGTELNVSSAMGLILLVGLVVKNGIVLLDYAHRRHAGGSSWQDAMEQAARVRLRPILMTTLCTLFGLLPLALGLGAGAELQKPLALAVIGGLAFSTPVVLYVVPSVYGWLHRGQ